MSAAKPCVLLAMIGLAIGPSTSPAAVEIHPEDQAILEEFFETLLTEQERLGVPRLEISRKAEDYRRDGRSYAEYSGRGYLRIGVTPEGRIEALDAGGPWFPNAVWPVLARFPELTSIRVDHNIIMAVRKTDPAYDGTGIAAMADSKLEELKIGHGFNDQGAEQAAKIGTLRTLYLVHCPVTLAGLSWFKGHPALEDIGVAVNPESVTREAMAVLATIPNLQTIRWHENACPYEGGWELLRPLQGTLKTVDITNSISTPEDLARLEADHPGIEIVGPVPARVKRLPKRRVKAIEETSPPHVVAHMQGILQGSN